MKHYKVCNCSKKPKKIPYGSRRSLYWCDNCDASLVPPINKSKARNASKKEIKKWLAKEEIKEEI